MSGSFDANAQQAVTLSGNLLSQGAKVIFPVAGPQTQLVLAAVTQSKNNAMVVGVDTAQETNKDLIQPMPNQGMAPGQNILAFSSLKRLDYSTEQVLKSIQTGDNSGGPATDGYYGLG